MAQTSPRRFGLLARLTASVFGGFTLLLAGVVGVSVIATLASLRSRGETYARFQLAYARAGVFAASGGTVPRAEAVDAVRRQLASVEPRLGLRVFDHGAPVGDSLPLDALDSEGLSRLRAGGAAPLGLRDPAYSGRGGFRFYAPLASDPEVAVSLRFPVELRQGETTSAAWLASVAVCAIVLLICWSLYVVLRRTIRRITRLACAIGDMASTGDFSVEVPTDLGNDELGDLYGGMYALVSLLRAIVDALEEACSKLATAGKSLTDTSQEQSEVLRNHSRAIDAAASSAEEICRTSETAAQRSEEVLEAAARAGDLGAAGESAVRDTLEGLGEIRGQVMAMTERIAMVAERARQISGITQSMKEIADSTGMLALNAAIEAIRSGEQGKGFSLVAREMRSLADQSLRATERVREILEDVAISIRQASAISSHGTQRIEAGLGKLTQSGESLRALARMVTESSQSAEVIGVVVRQQNAGIAQIVRSLADQRALSQRATASLSLTLVQAEELRSLTDQVGQLLKSYRF